MGGQKFGPNGRKTNPLAAFFRGSREMRHVQPLHLLCWQYAWYLLAWDHDREGIRTLSSGG